MKSNRFEALDSWRGICAVSVVLFHLGANGYYYNFGWVRNAHVFVPFFFVLSGFVICHAYRKNIQTRADMADFMLRRFGRLCPLHVAMLIPLLVLEFTKLGMIKIVGLFAGEPAFTGPTSLWALFTSAFLLHGMGTCNDFSWNGPSWSISVEFWTYLVFAIVVLFLMRFIKTASVFLILLAATIQYIFSKYGYTQSYEIGFFVCIYCFFAGVLTYCLREKLSFLKKFSGTLVEASLFLVLVWFMTNDRAINHHDFGCAAPLLFSAIVLAFSFEKGRLSSLFKRPLFLSLGKWSYSIYLTHYVILIALVSGTRALQQILHISLRTDIVTLRGKVENVIDLSSGHKIVNDGLAIVFVLAVIGVSALTYKYIEIPGQKFFRRFSCSAKMRQATKA